MLRNISWTSYLIFMLITLTGYYITICLKYYKGELKDIISGRHKIFWKIKSDNLKTLAVRNQNELDHQESNQNDLFSAVNQLTEEIKYSLEQAAASNLIKEELLYSLQQLAKKYLQIKASPFRALITNYILVESSNYGSIHLSEEDVNTMWAV